MKQLVAGTLLVLFSLLIFGYAGASLTHKVLHHFKNSIHHHHGHGHHQKKEPITHDHHDIDDHSEAIKKLNQKDQEEDKQSAEFISFFGLQIVPVLSIAPFTEAKVEKACCFYLNLYKTRALGTFTPPPSL